jgi:RNA polymerase-binding protein DksA
MSADIEQLRAQLELERDRLRSAMTEVEHNGSLFEETGDLALGTDDHIADSASDTLQRELDGGLEENVGRLLREIEAALERMENGTYGTCVECGREIDAERLEAVPYATLCIEDKRRLESS